MGIFNRNKNKSKGPELFGSFGPRPGRQDADTLKDSQGVTTSETTFYDASNYYANQYHNFISFTSVISGDTVKFKAFLTEFQDQFQSDWNSEQVYGRNDPIQTFRNTTRKISLGWDVPAASIWEAKVNMASSARLIRMLYPSYKSKNSVTTIDKAPLIQVKFRNLISNLTGEKLTVTLSGLTFSPDLEAGFFDADESRKLEGTIPEDELIPKLLKFSCEMTVLHSETIGHFPQATDGGEEASTLSLFPNLPSSIDVPWASSTDGGTITAYAVDNFAGNGDITFGDAFEKHEQARRNEAAAALVEAAAKETLNGAKSDYINAVNAQSKFETRKRQPEKKAEKIREQLASAQQGLINAGGDPFGDLENPLGVGTPGSGLTGKIT